MGDYLEHTFDEESIIIGKCYAVKLNGRSAFAKVIRRMAPNSQGDSGPAKWIGQRVGIAEGTDDEGKEVELLPNDFIGRASRVAMCIQALTSGLEVRQGYS